MSGPSVEPGCLLQTAGRHFDHCCSNQTSQCAFNLTASQADKEISYNLPFSSEKTCLTSHNVSVIVASLCVSPGNELLVLGEGGGALQFDKARPDLLAHLQDACLKIAANLINLITNMVFLMIASQFGLAFAYCCFKVICAF